MPESSKRSRESLPTGLPLISALLNEVIPAKNFTIFENYYV